MVSLEKDRTTGLPEQQLTPRVSNPLDTSFGQEVVYRGAELQRGNRQLATFLSDVARSYERIVHMQTTHVIPIIPNVLASVVAPVVMLAGGVTAVWSHVLTGVIITGCGFGLSHFGCGPVPLDGYCSLLEELASSRNAFAKSFQDPLATVRSVERDQLGALVIRYAIMAAAAVVPEVFREPTASSKLYSQLQRATFPLDLQIQPDDFLAPAIVKGEKFATDLKTLKLLSRLFDAAANFSLNGFECERVKFELRYKELQAHLDGSMRNHAAHQEQLDPQR